MEDGSLTGPAQAPGGQRDRRAAARRAVAHRTVGDLWIAKEREGEGVNAKYELTE
jgi:hypothetical protein